MALKDKLMTLEDFKAVRDVDVASNSAQFTEIKADLENLEPGLSDTAKAALLECIRHIARWDDDNGETYYNNLYEALYGVPIIAPVIRYNPASDGLLSAQDYVENAIINDGASESLVNSKLVLYALRGESQSVSSYVEYVIDEYNNVYGRLKIKAKLSATKFTTDTHISGSFRVEVSNATKGAQFYIMETNQGYLRVEYVVGTTRTVVTTTIEAEQYHDFDFIAKGDTQKLIIDGATVVNANGLSTQYIGTVRFWAMSGNHNTDIQLTVDSVEYYDEEG